MGRLASPVDLYTTSRADCDLGAILSPCYVSIRNFPLPRWRLPFGLLRRHREAELAGDCVQALISCPQPRPRRQPDRCKQVSIDIADAAPKEFPLVNEMEHLRIRGNVDLRQFAHGAKHSVAPTQIAERQFPDDERVRHHLPAVEEPRQAAVADTQMVDPDRGIDQDHLAADRRRGTGFKAGSVPARRANRRALSRSISALSASRTKADFSLTPVNA